MVYLNTFRKLSTSFLWNNSRKKEKINFFQVVFYTLLMYSTFQHDLFFHTFFRFIYLSLYHLFLYGSISFPRSLFISFSLSSSFTFPKALSFFPLSVPLCLSLSPTHYCSSLPPAHLQRPFFSFFLLFYGCDHKSSCHTADWFRSSHPDRVFSEL